MPSFPIRICLSDVKHPEKVERHPTKIPDVIHPGGKWRQPGVMWQQIFGCNVAATGWNSYHGGMWRQISGWKVESGKWRHPGGSGGRRVESFWQPDGMAATTGCNVQDPLLLVFWICLWIPKNSPQSWIALVIKKLSKYQNLTQFD